MRYSSLVILPLLLLLTACEGGGAERRAARGDTFVSDPDHLYFKNMRSRDYRAAELREGVDAYYHDGLDGELVIVDDWLEDRATLQLDGETLSVKETIELRQALTSGRDADPFTDQPAREAATEVTADYLRMVGADR